MAYTVLGDPVNLASRLESLNKHYGTRILVGAETLNAIGTRVAWRSIDVVRVKGKAQASEIGELADEAPAWWTAYRAAWSSYRAGQWRAAQAAFEAIVTGGEPDHVSAILAERCKRFAEQGVPSGWDGAWEMQDK